MSRVPHYFTYDGTLEGFLCTTVRCINMRVMPLAITPVYEVNSEYSSPDYHHVTTNFDIADKFYRYIGDYSSVEVQQMILDCFLTALPNKERDLYFFICKALKYGASIAEKYDDGVMHRVQMGIRDLYREAQSSLSEITYTPVNDVSVSVINPRNKIIPIVRNIVLKNENIDDMMLYDKRHSILLMRKGDREQVIDTTPISKYDISTPNKVYELMWNYFTEFDHIRNVSDLRGHKSAGSLSRLWDVAV